jgi:von Willebrand factor type A domain/Aerotolerance regulator N-terminal
MFFLNLSLGEFLALLGSLSGLLAALYLLDRTRRRKIVSTLRFWVDAPRVDEQRRRKRIREPWSLLLQLLSLLLLLLAIAQLQWGSRERSGRNHVIVLDTSSWMAERGGAGTLLDRAKERARRYLASLPPRDRLMLIRADSLATPATSFSGDRKELLKAIAGSDTSYTALNLSSALELASRAAKWSDGTPGEVVFVGGTRVARWDDENALVPKLRVLTVDQGAEDVGIRQLGVRRDPGNDAAWRAVIAVRNYGALARQVTLRLRFGATNFAPRSFSLQPGEDREQEFRFATSGGGTLVAALTPEDTLPLDDSVRLELPSIARARVAVYTQRPEAWRPFFEADKNVQAIYLPPERYTPKPDADLMLLDVFAPAAPPRLPSIWVMPPKAKSPIPILRTETQLVLNRWNADIELGEGLRAKEMRPEESEVFDVRAPAVSVASADEKPVVVARPVTASQPRLVEIGFDPLKGSARFDVSTPLLFANVLHWLEPDRFRTTELMAIGVGIASVPLDTAEASGRIRVVDASGFAVPFTVRNNALQMYVSKPSVVRVITPERERVLSMTLPGVGEFSWKPPAGAPRDAPPVRSFGLSAVDLWRWLAVAGALGLLAEWLIYGKQRPWKPGQLKKASPREAPEEHLVNR